MIKTLFFAALVTAVLLKNSHQHLLSFNIFPEERALPPTCGAEVVGKSYCLNCFTSEYCFSNGGSPSGISTTCSGSKPVCGLDGSSYACVASNANCQCPGTSELSYMADPFNEHFYTICFGTNTERINCGESYYNPEKHDCTGSPGVNPCSPPGGVKEDSDSNTCDGFIVCSTSTPSEITSTGKCSPPKNYFNPVIRNCDYPVPPFRCQAGYNGYYADPFDCRRYYFCNGANLLLSECCTKPGEVFADTTKKCLAGSCSELPPCAKGAAATTTSATTPSTTTLINPGCTPLTSFTCPAPDGFYAQCNYCANTYFQCVSGTATLKACSGNLLFNTVTTYPGCLSTCPYYP